MGTVTPAYSSHSAALLTQYKQRASELGANALYLTTGNQQLAFAIIASDAAASSKRMTPAQLAQRAQRPLGKYKALGDAMPLSFARAEFGLTTKRARCYAMTVVFDSDAPFHGRFIDMRSFSSELGCTSGTARAELSLWTKGKSTAIGSFGLRTGLPPAQPPQLTSR